MPEPLEGRIVAVCVVHVVIPDAGEVGSTAIDKRAVPGPVRVGALGLTGDTQQDTANHGGVDQAVYAYAREDAAWWAAELGREVPAGVFGENLATEGVVVSDAVVGEHWQVGAPGVGPLLQVRSPRVPCSTFQRWWGEPHWVKRFTEHGATGAYLKVLAEGEVSAGDPVRVVHRPAHGVTVREGFRGRASGAPTLRRLLEGDDDLDPRLADQLRKTLTLMGADG